MKQIWKYPLQGYDVHIEMPAAAQVLCCQVQRGVPCLWVLVDSDAPNELRRFKTYGTGWSIDEFLHYVGTFQLDGPIQKSLVWHVMEVEA